MLLPRPGDPEVGIKIFDILKDVLDDKAEKGLPDDWNLFYLLGINEHWAVQRTDISQKDANLLFVHRKRTVNQVCANNPAFNVAQAGMWDDNQDLGVSERKERLLRMSEYCWNENKWKEAYMECVTSGETYGHTIAKMVYDPDALRWHERYKFFRIDSFHFGTWPVDVKNNVQDATVLLHYYPLSVWEAKERWPEYKDQISDDTQILEELRDNRGTTKVGNNTERWGDFGGILAMLGLGKSTRVNEGKTLVVEAWVRDDPNEYPGGIRCVTVLNGGQLVVSDVPNPSINMELPEEIQKLTWCYDKFPISRKPSVIDPETGWGQSDFKQLKGLQQSFDEAITQYTNMVKRLGLHFVNPKGSGVPDSEITNVGGGTLHPDNLAMIPHLGYKQTPVIPPDVANSITLFKDLFFTVAQTFDLEQANTPGKEVIAYKALAALLENASMMQQDKVTNYSHLLTDMGRIWLSHVQNFQIDNCALCMERKDADDEIVEVSAETFHVPIQFSVVPGSTMPQSEIQKREESRALYKDGAMDRRTLLERHNIENIDQIISRLEAGPLAQAFDNLAKVGVPDGLMQWMRSIMSAQPNEIKRAIKEGEIPPFDALIRALAGQEQPEDIELLEARSKVELNRAKAYKEFVEAEIKKYGTVLDEETLKLKKAEYIDYKQRMDVEMQEKAKIERAKTVDEMEKASINKREQGPYIEKGMKSNNEQ